jgi:transcription initiation factor TFIID subunit 12
MLVQIAEEFVDSTLLASCQNAKHRKSNTVEAKDVQLYLGKRAHFFLNYSQSFNCFRTNI